MLGYEKILKVSEFEHFRPYGPKTAHTFKEGGSDLTPPPYSKGLTNKSVIGGQVLSEPAPVDQISHYNVIESFA